MRYLIAVALLVVGCGGTAAVTPSTAPVAVVTAATATTPTATPTLRPTATPDTLTPFVVHVVAGIDELAAGTDPTEWLLREGPWFVTATQSMSPVPPAIGVYAGALAKGMQTLIDETDPTAAVPAIVATRAAVAALAPDAVGTPPPTPAPLNPITVKGKGTTNTKPFFVAAGDYTVSITGKGNGNVIADLTLRDKSDYIPLFNELPSGTYRYQTIIYAVASGSYFFDMEVDGAWVIKLTPFR